MDLAQHARECIYFIQQAMYNIHIDFAQQAMEYIYLAQHAQ